MNDVEHRTLTADLVLREEAESDDFQFQGMVTTYGNSYRVMDYDEIIAVGAFDEYLDDRDNNVFLLVSHGGLPLASRNADTMTVTSTKEGVEIKARLSKDDPEAHSVAAKVKRGDVASMSVGMRINEDEWNEDGTERTIKRAELFEASITAFPANPATSAEVRSQRGVMLDTREEDEVSEAEETSEAEASVTREEFDALVERVEIAEGNLRELKHREVVLQNSRRRQLIDDMIASNAVLETAEE